LRLAAGLQIDDAGAAADHPEQVVALDGDGDRLLLVAVYDGGDEAIFAHLPGLVRARGASRLGGEQFGFSHACQTPGKSGRIKTETPRKAAAAPGPVPRKKLLFKPRQGPARGPEKKGLRE